VCNSGACGAPQGVVVLKVPLTATKQTQRYIDTYSMQVNLLGSFMVVRAYAPGAKAGHLSIFSSDADFTAGGSITVDLSEIASGWKDIKVNLGGALGAAFDPSAVRQVTLEVGSGPSGPWTNPTVVYIDGIRTTNNAVNETFDSSLGSMVKSDSPAVPGSTVSWLNALP
jgi:hypothetical protein